MNQLVYADAFRDALNSYRLSDEARKVLAAVRLLLFVAPTATGRDTIIRELHRTGNYHELVTDTTRKPRTNNGVTEQNGREYWFRSEEEMLEEIHKGQVVGAAVIHNQQVSGINVRELAAAEKDGKIAITDIEIVGATSIHRVKPDTMFMFMVPLSFDIWMERLHMRGYMAPDELLRRMASAERELSTALKADYFRFILNDTLEGTAAEIDRLVATGQYDPFKERSVREIAENMYKEVSDYLGKHSHRA
jgi:guanylate kinase